MRGRVLPTTLLNVVLKAECDDGNIISGESNVGVCGKRIKKIFLDPEQVVSTPEVIKAIYEADIIVLGPGSLYTSVLCNLAVDEVREAVLHSPAPVVFVCNVTTQPGETDHYKFADHLNAIFQFIPPERLNYILVNNEKPDSDRMDELNQRGIDMVNTAEINTYDSIKIYEAPLLSLEQPTRHDSNKLARALIQILTNEKPSWKFYFTLYTEDGFKNLKLVQMMNKYKKKKTSDQELSLQIEKNPTSDMNEKKLVEKQR